MGAGTVTRDYWEIAAYGTDSEWLAATGCCGHCCNLAEKCTCTPDDPCTCGPHPTFLDLNQLTLEVDG